MVHVDADMCQLIRDSAGICLSSFKLIYNLLGSQSKEKMGNLFCCVQVGQSTVAIKERFGRFEDVLGPGCHCLPWFLGSQLAGHLSLRLQQLDVCCETKTKVYQLLFYVVVFQFMTPLSCITLKTFRMRNSSQKITILFLYFYSFLQLQHMRPCLSFISLQGKVGLNA